MNLNLKKIEFKQIKITRKIIKNNENYRFYTQKKKLIIDFSQKKKFKKKLI